MQRRYQKGASTKMHKYLVGTVRALCVHCTYCTYCVLLCTSCDVKRSLDELIPEYPIVLIQGYFNAGCGVVNKL